MGVKSHFRKRVRLFSKIGSETLVSPLDGSKVLFQKNETREGKKR